MELYFGAAPGTYTFSYQNYEMGEAYFHVDRDGQDVLYVVVSNDILNAANSGTFTFLDGTNSTIDGAVDLTFPDGHLTGSFTAAVCTTAESTSQSR